LKEQNNGGCVLDHWGITGFAVQQRDSLDFTGNISCAVTLPCSVMGVTTSWQQCSVGK